MNIILFILGILCFVTAPLVYHFPNLVSGYNTMSAEKRKNVDIVGLKKELAIILSVMGIVYLDRKSTRLNSSHIPNSRIPSSA